MTRRFDHRNLRHFVASSTFIFIDRNAPTKYLVFTGDLNQRDGLATDPAFTPQERAANQKLAIEQWMGEMVKHSDAPAGSEIFVFYILAFFKREFTGFNVLGQIGDYGEFD